MNGRLRNLLGAEVDGYQSLYHCGCADCAVVSIARSCGWIRFCAVNGRLRNLLGAEVMAIKAINPVNGGTYWMRRVHAS